MLTITIGEAEKLSLTYSQFVGFSRRDNVRSIAVISGPLAKFDFAGLVKLKNFMAPSVGLRLLVNVSAKHLPELYEFKAPRNLLTDIDDLLTLPVLDVVDVSYNRIQVLHFMNDVKFDELRLDHNPFSQYCQVPRVRKMNRDELFWTESVFKFLQKYPEAVRKQEDAQERRAHELMLEEEMKTIEEVQQ